MRVDTLLAELLRATAAKTAASRRVERLRDVLDTEARRRYLAEGAAPSWKAPSLGSVRLDPKSAEAFVADDDAFASYVAERFPSEVEATVLIPAAELEAALEALSFAGVTVHRSEARVRPSFTKALLTDAEVIYSTDPAECAVMRVLDRDAGTVEPIAGTGVLEPSATLVVTLDRDAKRRTLETVDAELDVELSVGRPVETVSLPEALELANQPADALERQVIADDLANREARQQEDADTLSLAARQRAHAEAHAADVGARLEEFARTGTAPAVRQPGEAPLEPNLAEVLLDELDAPRDHAGERLDRHRTPYVGDGADGARRSAEIDRTELDGLAADDPRRPDVEASLAAWEQQAAELEAAGPEGPPLEVLGIPVTVDETIPAGSAELRNGDGETVATIVGLDQLDDADLGADAGLPLPEPAPGVVDELARMGTDDLKLAARLKRVPVSGTKVILAARLAKAGLDPAGVRELITANR